MFCHMSAWNVTRETPPANVAGCYHVLTCLVVDVSFGALQLFVNSYFSDGGSWSNYFDFIGGIYRSSKQNRCIYVMYSKHLCFFLFLFFSHCFIPKITPQIMKPTQTVSVLNFFMLKFTILRGIGRWSNYRMPATIVLNLTAHLFLKSNECAGINYRQLTGYSVVKLIGLYLR